jgi:hypothetical protein
MKVQRQVSVIPVLALIDHVAAGGGPLPAIIRRDTADRVPLFVEEITKARLVAPKWGALGPGIDRH